MAREAIGVLISLLYVGAALAVGELARRRFSVPRGAARKFVHVAAGLWVFGTLALFESRWFAALPAAVSIAGNYLAARRRLFAATEEKEGQYGTVWFPASFLLLILLAWDRPEAILAGMLAMTLGDTAAEAVGARWGRHPYAIWGRGQKSWEGSLAMAAATGCALVAIDLPPAVAVIGAIVGAAAEALGPRGLDNLWVPLAVGAVVYWSPGLPVTQIAIGAVCALMIGMGGYMRGSLSPSGVLGALVTGALVFGLGTTAGAVALVAFFVSSSLLGRVLHRRTVSLETDYAKGGRRDLGQALANGGVAAACAVLYALTGDGAWAVALLGSLAAANADTWATELGGAFGGVPRLITSLRPVPAGTSGGITLAGLAASVAGAGFIAGSGLITAAVTVSPETALAASRPAYPFLPAGFLAIMAGGVAGSLLDSLLGATVQAMYWCPACMRQTERAVHGCGTETVHLRGLPWLGNDAVNLLATAFGAGVSYLLITIGRSL